MEYLIKKLQDETAEIMKEYLSMDKADRGVRWINKQVKIRLGDIAITNNLEVASSEHNGEWLYDLVFYKKVGANLQDILLTMEVELSDRTEKGLKFDFEKLLFSTANHRIFLCLAQSNCHEDSILNVRSILEKSYNTFNSNKNPNPITLMIWDDYNTGEIYVDQLIKNDVK